MLEALEATSLAIWLRESPSVWSFPAILTLHTTGMAVLVGASWVLALRLLGISRNVPLSAFRWVFKVVAIGLIVNLTTGVMLFFKNATVWGVSLPFFIKMGLVIASAATLLPLRAHVLGAQPGQTEVTGNARMLAIASLVAWTGAVTMGRMLAYLGVF